ncbi:hypothetical protein CsSME_00016178 [Camellia sinensis var. sinensis]
MDDMIAWMQEGGQVGIFDATNSMKERRNMLMKMAEGKCKVYEPVEEGSYIKMIDMVSGQGGQIQKIICDLRTTFGNTIIEEY